jgi:hypothetical protein
MRNAEAWELSKRQLGYARALAWLDGRVHLVASTRGAVLRIENFPARRLRTYRSPGKRMRAPAGAWSTTGLVLNDVAQFGGWYYGTNYFCPHYSAGADARPCRLIRWRTWQDFASGHWEDVSSALAPGLVPYFLTATDSALYLVVFCHDDHRRDAVLRLEDTGSSRRTHKT